MRQANREIKMIGINEIAKLFSAEELAQALNLRLSADNADLRMAEQQAQDAAECAKLAAEAAEEAQRKAISISDAISNPAGKICDLSKFMRSPTFTRAPQYPVNSKGRPVAISSKAAREYLGQMQEVAYEGIL